MRYIVTVQIAHSGDETTPTFQRRVTGVFDGDATLDEVGKWIADHAVGISEDPISAVLSPDARSGDWPRTPYPDWSTKIGMEIP